MEVVPANLSTKEAYRRLGAVKTDHQRGILHLMIRMSREGMWMRIAHAEEEGFTAASKRISEMRRQPILGIAHRHVKAECVGGRQSMVSEYCMKEKA